MLTLSYGYYKMETGDRGAVWFPAIEDNFQRLNDHTHNGTDSALIPPSSIVKTAFKTVISGASWGVDLGGSTYRQTITVPAGVAEINNYLVQFYVTATGERVFLEVVRVSATTYYVYSNLSTLAVTALYV